MTWAIRAKGKVVLESDGYPRNAWRILSECADRGGYRAELVRDGRAVAIVWEAQ